MKNKVGIKQLLAWVHEAQTTHQEWRKDSWQDYEFRDGKQWSASDIADLVRKGVKELTINRTFPIMNFVQGHYLLNQRDIVAKGRTKQDNELAQVMSEGVQFVIDQNNATQLQSVAFNQSITTGVGFLGVGFNPDPRKEKVRIIKHDWYSVWWDPFASPWLNKDECRYAFTASWTDLSDLIALFPEKEAEIKDQFDSLTTDNFVPDVYDEGTEIEDYKKYISFGQWANTDRKRVRPVELWYTQVTKSWFAVMPNGRVIDLDTIDDVNSQYTIIQEAKEVVTANVKKMRVATFLGNLILQDCCSPYVHDEYPFVPFVGYLDRYNFPFGIPRQIKEQNMEVNKRRSMALALLNSRRTFIEEGASENANITQEEVNRHDGFIVMNKGKLDKIKVDDLANMAPAQMSMLEQSEREMQEISGSTEQLGNSQISNSSKALEKKEISNAVVTASLFENSRHSQKILGERVAALIQDSWTDEKVLRVTDRMTGTEKFVAINERVHDGTGIVLRNDITQATFDFIISNKPITDTVREKNMDLIFSAINKATPEAVGPLLNLALELSDIPNKDILLQQVRKATGVEYIDDSLTTEEREAQERLVAEAKAEEDRIAKEQAQYKQDLENDELAAKAEKLRAEAHEALTKAETYQQDVNQKGWQIGQQAATMQRNNGDHIPKPKGLNNDVTKRV